jgi:GntR family transcriptional regulator/MocR family aminotransferase
VDLHVSLDGSHDLSGQIYRQIREAILDRRLRPGELLPSTRDAAARLSVSRNTVTTAYDHLIAEGFLTSRTGVGTYVSESVATQAPQPSDPAITVPSRVIWAEMRDPPVLSSYQPLYDFRAGMPDAHEFPYATWRAFVADELRETAIGSGAYGDPAGHLGLRNAIAHHIGVSRSVKTTADQILITSGTQQALDLISRVLLEPGDVVAVEEPGYEPARLIFEMHGAKVVPVPVDREGLDVDGLPANGRAVYVSPSHQFPLGVRMSLPRRQALLAWAERSGAVVIEDDYDGEFRYTGRPIDPLQSLDQAGRVIYVGSFSKTMLPTLRLGFCVAPPSLFGPMRKAKFVCDWHAPLPMQAALAHFIERGQFAKHVRRMRGIYLRRREIISMTLDREFAPYLRVIPSGAGLHMTATLTPEFVASGGDARAISRRARARDVGIRPLGNFAMNRDAFPGLVIGYGMVATDQIADGLARLHESVTCGESVTGPL